MYSTIIILNNSIYEKFADAVDLMTNPGFLFKIVSLLYLSIRYDNKYLCKVNKDLKEKNFKDGQNYMFKFE